MNEKHEDNLDRVWDIIEKVGVTMLTTQFSGGLRPAAGGAAGTRRRHDLVRH